MYANMINQQFYSMMSQEEKQEAKPDQIIK